MVKTIHVQLPVHIKKFFMHEYNGYQKKNGHDEIYVERSSGVGKLVHLCSRPIPYTQPMVKSTAQTLSIRYYVHVQSMEVANDKLPLLSMYLDDLFRTILIAEVAGGHELTGCDYGPLVAKFLMRRGIERDVDIDFQTARKIYRDHIAKKNRKTAKMYAQNVT